MFRDPYARLNSEYNFVNMVCSAIGNGRQPVAASGVITAIGHDA
jgi:hypothetical protein